MQGIFPQSLTSTFSEEANSWKQAQEELVGYLTNPVIWTQIFFVALKIVLIFVAGRIVIKLANKALEHMLVEREKHPLKFDQRRTKTIGKLLGNVITYIVNFIVILMILSQFNIQLQPVLAGAGVLGLAIGFGAQSLVKDVITGFFIIFEDQFAVGDVVQIGTFKGSVEEIGLRVTKIKSWTGELHIIPNGTIAQVTNFSVNNSLAIVDVSIAYEEDIDRAVTALKETVEKVYESNANMMRAPEVLGVQSLGPSEVVLRVTAECKPNTQAGVSRELFAEVKKTFDLRGIEIPYPKVVNYHKNQSQAGG